ncbi:hypothetical protein [Agromyces sp. ZXT2-6]|uniref:hypothetical protein n=1 Tax=Agromyces sp. ZXT2-6 TaxID=3461153 RepID=UPI004054CFB3
MHATLSRVSLVTEIDAPHRPPDRRYVEDPAHFDVELSRVLMHEATHYWQQLSSPALLILAGDDWQSLLRFRSTGSADGTTTLRPQFTTPHPAFGFSILDLVECLSRYWDILNTGPHDLVEAELAEGGQLSPELAAELEDARVNGLFRSDDDGFSFATVSLAMRIIGGSYARPYRDLEQRLGFMTVVLFPLIAHWALQTNDPVRMFDAFTLRGGSAVARSLKRSERMRFLRPRVSAPDLEEEQERLYLKLVPLMMDVAKGSGTEVRLGSEALAYTALADHPVYRWAIDWVSRLGHAAMTEGLGRDVRRRYRGDEVCALIVADRMLALPGGDHRSWLHAYLTPPVHRFNDGLTWYTNVEPVHDDNVRIADQCIEIHTAWEEYRQARRGY